MHVYFSSWPGIMGKIAAITILILATAPVFSAHPKFAHRVFANYDKQVPLGNLVQGGFNQCLSYVVSHPTDVPLDHQLLQSPISQYHIPADAWGHIPTFDDRPYLPVDKNRYHTDVLRYFRCFLLIISTSSAGYVTNHHRVWTILDWGHFCETTKYNCLILPSYLVTFIHVHVEGRYGVKDEIVKSMALKKYEIHEHGQYPTPTFILASSHADFDKESTVGWSLCCPQTRFRRGNISFTSSYDVKRSTWRY